ncbi:MAG: heme-binding beta-barrel domain-containing protein [Mariprofundaceae bacterium]
MATIDCVDYGPLQYLIGVWKGREGLDVAPEPGGSENNPYHETIMYKGIGHVTNAESQCLSVVHYRQIVQRKSNDEVFHDQTGYWMWYPKEETIMHSLVIPRAVCVLAGGFYREQSGTDESIVLEVSAKINDKNWGIIQSPFMQENARTTNFHQRITVLNEKLTYYQTTMVEIYGKDFEHTDQSELTRQRM